MKLTAKRLSNIIREAASEAAQPELSKQDVILADKTSQLLVQANATLRNASDARLRDIREQLVKLGNKLWSLY